MMSESTKVLLKDISTELSDGLHKAPKFVYNGEYLFVNATNLENGHIVEKDKAKRTTHEEYLKYSVPLTDRTILYSIDGTIGNIARYRGEKCVLGKGACYINLKDSVNYDYVYYQLQSHDFNEYIRTMATGSTIRHISLKTMRNYCFNLPPLPTQHRIAAILSSLDDKIENNRKTCEKLEEVAQAIFKRWFVEFEFPNEDGQPYKSTGGEMVYCEELGKEIPKGWRVKPFGDIVDSISERHSFNKPELIFLNTSDIYNGEVLKSEYTNITTLPGQAKKSIQIKDILYSEIRPKNRRFAYIDFECMDYVVSTKLMVLRCKDSKLSSLVYFYLTNQDTINNLQTLAESRSGTFPQIRFDNLKNMTVALPMHCSKFTSFFETFLEQMQMNRREIKSLQQTRDALLPKLMSGELTVDDVAK